MISLYNGDWRDLLSPDGIWVCASLRSGGWIEWVPDAVITDPPYGARTHAAYKASRKGHAGGDRSKLSRKAIEYGSMSPRNVRDFVAQWAPRCRGWFVVMTSHDLVPAWHAALERAGRYVFAPLPFYSRGCRIRLSGDGPSSWVVWIVVARPRSIEFSRWGTLPGGYSGPTGKLGMAGGKPEWLLRALIRDYTKRGDLVVDPCAGMATALIAARAEGRICVGAEIDPDTYASAAERLAQPHTMELFG